MRIAFGTRYGVRSVSFCCQLPGISSVIRVILYIPKSIAPLFLELPLGGTFHDHFKDVAMYQRKRRRAFYTRIVRLLMLNTWYEV